MVVVEKDVKCFLFVCVYWYEDVLFVCWLVVCVVWDLFVKFLFELDLMLVFWNKDVVVLSENMRVWWVCDYIVGMMDCYVIDEYCRLFDDILDLG